MSSPGLLGSRHIHVQARTLPLHASSVGGGVDRSVERSGGRDRDYDRVQTLRLCKAWVHLWAMDFAGVLEICEPVLTTAKGTIGSAAERFCQAVAASRRRLWEAMSGLLSAFSE
jgi:hypothetical protein